MLPRQVDSLAVQEDQGQSDRQGQDNDQGQTLQPAPENWQQLLVDLQARVMRQEEEICLLSQQQVLVGNILPEAPPVTVPTVELPPEAENKWEPLYERFNCL